MDARMDAVVWDISSQFFGGYLALVLPSFFLALYYIYYLLFVVSKPRVVGARGEFHKMMVECCPTLSSYYWPTFWAFHCHLTTILRAVLQKPPNITYKRELFTLMDGGEVALDWVDPWEEEEEEDIPVLLILPGITGNSADAYIKHLVQDGLMEGYRAVVFNQRGTGGVDLKTLRMYSGTDISDVKEVVKRIQSLYPHALVVGVGVSLGGMILTQYLHQTGEQCKLHAVLTISTAWDAFKTQESLENNFMNKILYSRFLTNEIKKLVRRNLKSVTPEQIKQLPSSIEEVLQCQTISQFDALITAPQFGYASLHDYYAASSNWDKLYRIQRPLLCITAADDPFVPKESLPFAEFESNLLAVLAVTSHGGHFGFLEGLLPTQQTWMDRVSREYLRAIKNYHSCI